MGAPTHSISCHHRSLFLVNDTQDNTLKASIIPPPAPLPSCSQLQLIPCVDILTRLNIPALLCNSATTAPTLSHNNCECYTMTNWPYRRQHRKATRCKCGNSQGNVRRTRVLLSCEDAVLRVGGQFTYNQLFHLLHLGCSPFPKD